MPYILKHAGDLKAICKVVEEKVYKPLVRGLKLNFESTENHESIEGMIECITLCGSDVTNESDSSV
jgi:hypothetical protein